MKRNVLHESLCKRVSIPHSKFELSDLPFACCPPSEPMFKCRVADHGRPDGKPQKMGKCDRLSRVQWTIHLAPLHLPLSPPHFVV